MFGWVLLALVLAALSGCDDGRNSLPGDDLVAGDPPADELPVEELPVDELPVDELPADDPPAGELSGDWVRLGYPDCEGTLPLQELPVERHFIFNNLLNVEQNGDDLTLSIGGRWVGGARLIGTLIFFESGYGVAIDADPPLRYAEISVSRQGQTLDDGSLLMFQDHYESYGDFLVCEHVFERA